MKLKFTDARIVRLTKYPNDPHTTQVLEVAATLTPPLAEKLHCRQACYTEDGIPRRWETYPAPALHMDGADVNMDHIPGQRADLIHKFKISQPKAAGDNDISLEIRMKMHFAGDVPLSEWADVVNKDPFELRINASQEEFQFDDGPQPGEGDLEDEAAIEEDKAAAAEPVLARAQQVGGTHQRKKAGLKPVA